MFHFSGHRGAVAGILGLASLLVTAAPVAADHELGHTGQVGPHSFIDSQAASSVTCTYDTVRVDDGVHKVKIARIEARPPMLRAISGQQVVGWRFIVQRHPSSDYSLTAGNWKTTYRSPIQRATATVGADAAFTPMTVPVTLPRGNREHDSGYHVLIKMFWYFPNGSVQGTALHELSYYDKIVEGQLVQRWPNWCAGREWWLMERQG